MATVRIEYYGMDGAGPTVTAAKADASRKIERALSGSYAPSILRLGPWAALLYREARSGWIYALVATPEEGLRDLSGCTMGDSECRADVERRARHHLAQLAQFDMGDEAALAFAHKDDRAELRRYFAWQTECKAAMDAGCSEAQARERAARASCAIA